MSVDVMYQPYVPYLPYQRPGQNAMDQFKKYCPQRIPDPLDVASYSSSSLGSASSLSGNSHISSPSSTVGSGGATGITSGSSTGHPTGHSTGHTPGHSTVGHTQTSADDHQSSTGGGSISSSLVLKEELMDQHHQHIQQNTSHQQHHLNSHSLHSGSSGSGGNSSKDTDSHPTATHYVSANCVLLTYFNGDAATNVDEHFSRALSQPSSFNAENQGTKPTPSWRDLAPMSQRNFPASFWNSSYHSNTSGSLASTSGHPDFSFSDPYMTASSLHSMSSLQDHWRYPLGSQSTHPYSHSAAAMHDLAYSSMAAASSASRFNSHYGSFLPSARLGAAQCDLVKHSSAAADAWGSRYGESLSAAAAHHDSHALHTGLTAGGIDSVALPDPSKDLYWF